MNSTSPPTPGTTLRYFGDYLLLGEIAHGGMGVVYDAWQVSLDRRVALKLIRSGEWATDAEVRRFQTEAKAVAKLDHPHIVPIYEVGRHEGHHFISMKRIEGESLAERLAAGAANFRRPNDKDRMTKEPTASRGPFDFRHSAFVIAKMAHALAHAHARGVLHRDLKPSNILLDAQGEPHLTDFGLARLVEDGSVRTRSTAVLGTPSYMAPEQAAGKTRQVSVASDLYGLGAVLYELLTGRPPFCGASPAETLDWVQNREPPRPRALSPSVPADLETICLKCLEKEPNRRYLSAQALAEDLEHWLHGEPIVARPARPWERLGKWARRNPVTAALAASLTLGPLFTLIGLTWLWQRGLAARMQEPLPAPPQGRASTTLDAARARRLSFTRAASLAVGNAPFGLTAADLNRDGWPDVVTANYRGNNLTVLTNDSRGGLARAGTLPIVNHPRSVAATDVNLDSWVDLAVAVYGDEGVGINALVVLTNNGQGGFQLSEQADVAGTPWDVVADDLNKDGWPDVVTANFMTNTLTVFTNNRQGQMRLASTLPVGAYPAAVLTPDLTQDGWNDLVSANWLDGTLSVLTNDGHGGYVASAILKAGKYPSHVRAYDLNNDGWKDLINPNHARELSQLTVHTNDSRGGLGYAGLVSAGRCSIDVGLADLNGDGWGDVVSVSSMDANCWVLTNDHSGGFRVALTLPVDDQPTTLVLVDLNQDGYLDIVTVNERANTVSVILQEPPGE